VISFTQAEAEAVLAEAKIGDRVAAELVEMVAPYQVMALTVQQTLDLGAEELVLEFMPMVVQEALAL
jgi:hypothetical protein